MIDLDNVLSIINNRITATENERNTIISKLEETIDRTVIPNASSQAVIDIISKEKEDQINEINDKYNREIDFYKNMVDTINNLVKEFNDNDHEEDEI